MITIKIAKHIAKNYNILKGGIKNLTTNLDNHNLGKSIAKAVVQTGVEAAAMPTAVVVASELGVTASTGTAISSLSGAAATSATAAAIGAPVAEALGAVGVAVAPAVAGAVIVASVGLGVGYLLTRLFD